MPIALQILADVFDINSYVPQKQDVFLVDTNVWVWMTYRFLSSNPKAYQTASYPNFVSKAMKNKASLLRFDLSYSELANIIERDEYELFSAQNRCNPKEFRYNYPRLRQTVVNKVLSSWKQVCTMSSSRVFTIDAQVMGNVESCFHNYPLGGYDLFFIEALKDSNITGILTDDMDFACYPGIKVFTANNKVINQARALNKLMTS